MKYKHKYKYLSNEISESLFKWKKYDSLDSFMLEEYDSSILYDKHELHNYRNGTYLYNKTRLYYVFTFENIKYVALNYSSIEIFKFRLNELNKREEIMNIEAINKLWKYCSFIQDEKLKENMLQYIRQQYQMFEDNKYYRKIYYKTKKTI